MDLFIAHYSPGGTQVLLGLSSVPLLSFSIEPPTQAGQPIITRASAQDPRSLLGYISLKQSKAKIPNLMKFCVLLLS